MVRRGIKQTVLTVALFAAVTMVFLSGPATAASVEPVFVDGNPTCAALGYDFEFKVDPPVLGTTTYNLPGFSGNTVTVTTADGVYFDWTSTLGMDAVISKGGSAANEYVL